MYVNACATNLGVNVHNVHVCIYMRLNYPRICFCICLGMPWTANFARVPAFLPNPGLRSARVPVTQEFAADQHASAAGRGGRASLAARTLTEGATIMPLQEGPLPAMAVSTGRFSCKTDKPYLESLETRAWG